jgi:cytochrome bd ubiquinol oxidase subunit II
MTALQMTWYLLVGVLLTGYAILDGFDLGTGILYLFVAKEDRERRILLNAIGPLWDGNEVWLLTGGGALFAAFPPVYATVFSGFYLALVLLLVALIARAVSFEFRSKVEAPAWRRLWDGAFAFGSFLPALLLGVALGNMVRGVPVDARGEFTGNFFTLLNLLALLVGLTAVAFFVRHGALFLSTKTEGALLGRVLSWEKGSRWAFLALYLATTAAAYAIVPERFANFIANPVGWVAPALTLVSFFLAGWAIGGGKKGLAFFFSTLVATGLMGTVGWSLFPNLVPSTTDPAFSLTAANSSSSPLTLGVMLVIALVGVPIVLAYTTYIYKVFWGKVVMEENSY